jgi:hypothetical protein
MPALPQNAHVTPFESTRGVIEWGPMNPVTPAKKPILCAACFFKEHRPPLDEAWIGALMGMVMFDLAALCPEHGKAALRMCEAAAGPHATATARLRLRVINGGSVLPLGRTVRPPKRRR